MQHRFEDLKIWQKSKDLAKSIYMQFSGIKDFGFKDQIQRAAVSVMNNIAEGAERNSSLEFQHFLFIAKGSCGEVRSMLILAIEINYINKTEAETLIRQTEEISKMIFGLTRIISQKSDLEMS